MCGRFQMDPEAYSAVHRLARIPSFVEVPLGMIYPSQKSLVIAGHDGRLVGELAAFGWDWQEGGKRFINARSETAWNSPLFGPRLRTSRVAVPASCFYEWDAAKQMIACREKGSPVLYMAGFLAGNSFVILTTAANASVRDIHHRMPLILSPEEVAPWILDPARTQAFLRLVPPMMETDALQPRLF